VSRSGTSCSAIEGYVKPRASAPARRRAPSGLLATGRTVSFRARSSRVEATASSATCGCCGLHRTRALHVLANPLSHLKRSRLPHVRTTGNRPPRGPSQGPSPLNLCPAPLTRQRNVGSPRRWLPRLCVVSAPLILSLAVRPSVSCVDPRNSSRVRRTSLSQLPPKRSRRVGRVTIHRPIQTKIQFLMWRRTR